MNLTGWLIVIIPLILILSAAFYARRYVRDIADYLASGRVAGRYVISVGDLSAGLSVITLVALCEQNYQCGMAMSFWGAINTPLALFISLSGYCIYRFRQTRCLSAGQFFELRYSRSFRIVAAFIRTFAEMVTNAIGPAVAVRFFIYFLGIPHKIPVFGMEIPTYGILVAVLLLMALAIIWPAGRISLLITDCFQGIISYPIFVIFTVFILTNISWFQDVAPVMLDRNPGESFLNPMDIQGLRDFNIFALIVTVTNTILNRAAWIGNDTTNAGRTPHEQKMASILGTWRNGFAFTMMTLIGIFVITFMLHDRFAPTAHDIRINLTEKVGEEVFAGKNLPDLHKQVVANVAKLPVAKHTIGVDAPYSRTNNPDAAFLDTTLKTVQGAKVENGNGLFQEFRSLYYQMMMPTMLRTLFPPVLMGIFALLMMMLLLSTDDSRIFNASSTLIQDVILPFRKTPLSMEEHLKYLKLCSLGVTLFFFIISLFFAQLDYINMFVTIMCAVWTGAAGPIMVGGLYTRFGTTFGAWCALIFGSGLSIVGLACQRNWADYIYPWLARHNYASDVGAFLEMVSSPFHPYVVWAMDPIKFPINSMEIFFMSMVLGVGAYVIGSLITYKEPYNLDRLFHRGIYSDEAVEIKPEPFWTWRNFYQKVIGITEEYTTGDKVIAWSVFGWSLVYSFGVMFCGVLIWNVFAPWPAQHWAIYFFITTIAAALLVGGVSTVWFLVGGLIDMRALFRDLEARVANPLDNGVVEGHVSLADKARFDAIEHTKGAHNEKSGDQ